MNLKENKGCIKDIIKSNHKYFLQEFLRSIKNTNLKEMKVEPIPQKRFFVTQGIKIRIKDEYEGDNIDPYMLYRMPSIRQEIVQNFLNKHSQTPVDAVSGHYDKNSPLHLKEIQRNLYQSDLPEFLAKYLKTVDIKASPALIQAVLRLVLLNFQVYEQSDDLLLKQKVEKNFLNENFAEILKKISTEESLKDCKICVENIQDYLQMYGPISSDDEEAPKSKNLNDKKRLMEERMAKVKQDFAQKQALFAQKNQQDLKTDPAKKWKKGTILFANIAWKILMLLMKIMGSSSL